jgi:hypothetical protein
MTKRNFGLNNYPGSEHDFRFTTPPDISRCIMLREDGPTPCWHPYCNCFPKVAPESRWEDHRVPMSHGQTVGMLIATVLIFWLLMALCLG